MSTAKKPKATLPTPPPRTRSVSPSPRKTKPQLPISINPRTRSRSANNRPRIPDHPTPPAPQRNNSRNRIPNKPNKLPTIIHTKSRNKTNKKLPTKLNEPNTPSIRKRSKTTAPIINTKQKRVWSPIWSIDNRPMLKSSNSVKKKPLPKYNQQKQEQKENVSSKPPPPPKTSGHSRDYSIVKSIPLMFKTPSVESPKNKGLRFGLKAPPKKKGLPVLKKRESLLSGSCQCENIKYELFSLPQELQHCYCSMCRKMHGSSVATWTPYLEQDIKFMSKGKQTKYKSSQNVIRSFCSKCGSNISLKYSFQKDTIWLTPSLFDGGINKNKNDINVKTWWLNVRILHIFCASKCEWYDIPNDSNPQLSQSDIQNSEINGEPRFLYSKELPPKPSQN